MSVDVRNPKGAVVDRDQHDFHAAFTETTRVFL